MVPQDSHSDGLDRLCGLASFSCLHFRAYPVDSQREELLCTEEDSKLRRVEERKSPVRRAGLVSNGPLSWHLTTCRASGYPMQQMRQLWARSRGAKSQETQSWRSLQRGKCCHVASMSVMAWCMLCRLLQRRCGGTCFIPFPGICEHEGTELISVESNLSL